MKKSCFLTLSITAGLLCLILLASLFIQYSSMQLNKSIVQNETYLNQAGQKDAILKRLALRMAQDGQKDPDIRDIMVKNEIKVILNEDGKKITFP